MKRRTFKTTVIAAFKLRFTVHSCLSVFRTLTACSRHCSPEHVTLRNVTTKLRTFKTHLRQFRWNCDPFSNEIMRTLPSIYSLIKDGKVVPLRSIEAHLGDRRYSSCSFLTSTLEEGEWSASRPGRALPPGERAPGTHCIGGWVGPRAGLDAEVRGKILCLCQGSNHGRPVRSQTLYWPSYSGYLT
jgi:hypothetical protein